MLKTTHYLFSLIPIHYVRLSSIDLFTSHAASLKLFLKRSDKKDRFDGSTKIYDLYFLCKFLFPNLNVLKRTKFRVKPGLQKGKIVAQFISRAPSACHSYAAPTPTLVAVMGSLIDPPQNYSISYLDTKFQHACVEAPIGPFPECSQDDWQSID